MLNSVWLTESLPFSLSLSLFPYTYALLLFLSVIFPDNFPSTQRECLSLSMFSTVCTCSIIIEFWECNWDILSGKFLVFWKICIFTIYLKSTFQRQIEIKKLMNQKEIPKICGICCCLIAVINLTCLTENHNSIYSLKQPNSFSFRQ